jgi:hypothetical protein
MQPRQGMEWFTMHSVHQAYDVTANLGRSYALHARALSKNTAFGARAPAPEELLLLSCPEGALRQARQTAAYSVITSSSLVIINELPASTDQQQCNCQPPVPTKEPQACISANYECCR